MSEYNSVVQAVDVIRSFLDTHESNSTTCLWESDIDGTILKTDWGYFEEGLDEIRDYCERLDTDRKNKPQTDCDGCQHYADEHTADACYECKRAYADCYESQANYDKGLKLFADILFDKEKSEQFLKECEAMGIEPQTERSE